MPGAKLEIPILFTPREIRKYQETIRLDFDGLYQVEIQVNGSGTSLNLGLKDPEQQLLDLLLRLVALQLVKRLFDLLLLSLSGFHSYFS